MKYDAFISYRHLENDMFVAKGVHRALESAKIPRKIQKQTGKKRIKRVFRDQEELPIGSDLGNNIEAALAESEFLIVICSPQTKESYWVMTEINTFIATHGRQNVLAVLVEGEPEDSFPPQLIVDENGNNVEPLAADVRGSSKKEVAKKIKSETLRLAASILHCDYDDLKQRHRERIMKRNMTIAAAVAALGVVFGIYNAYNVARINENYQQKLVNESKVLASTSADVLENGDRQTAALIAMEALPSEDNDRPFVPDAMYALSNALCTYRTGRDVTKDKILRHHLSVEDFSYASDGSRICSYDYSSGVYYWDVKSSKLLFYKSCEYIEGEQDKVVNVLALPDKAVVVSNNYLTVYDEEGNAILEKHYDMSFSSAEFNHAQTQAVLNNGDEMVVINLSDGEVVQTIESAEGQWYTSNIVFSDDDKKILVGHGRSQDESIEYGFITVADIESGETTVIQIAQPQVLDINFTPDDCVAVSTLPYNGFFTFDDVPLIVQKFDYKTGEELFKTELVYDNATANMSYAGLKSRIYTDDNGVERKDMVVGGCKTIYDLDLETGELNWKYVCEDFIENFRISTLNSYIYIGIFSGKILAIDGVNGTAFSDNVVECSGSVMHFAIGGGHYVISGYRSPNIEIMSFISDSSAIEIGKLNDYLPSVVPSVDGSSYTYYLTDYPDYGTVTYYTYDSETDQRIAEFSIPEADRLNLCYIDADTLAIPTHDDLLFYNIRTGEQEQLDISKYVSFTFPNPIYSRNRKYVMLTSADDYVVFDLESRQPVYGGSSSEEYTSDTSFYNTYLCNDGKTVYFSGFTNKVFRLNVETDELKQLMDEYSILTFSVSSDDKYVLACCSDGKLRIFNTETEAVDDELEFYGNSSSFMRMSSDDSLIYMQGADLYFKIYDCANHKYVFSMDSQIQDVSSITEDTERGILSIRGYTYLYLIDIKKFGCLGYAEYGSFYLPDQQYIVTTRGYDIYKFKVKNLEQLFEEARTQFPDAQLTDEQRNTYHIN